MTDNLKDFKPSQNSVVETLGLNDSKVGNKNTKKHKLINDKNIETKPVNKTSGTSKKDSMSNTDQLNTDLYKKESILLNTEKTTNSTQAEENKLNKKAIVIQKLPLKSILAQINEGGNNEEKNIKVNISGRKPIEKRKVNYNKFEEENSSVQSSSLPSSKASDFTDNISAIEIDKNEISIHKSPRKKIIVEPPPDSDRDHDEEAGRKIGFIIVYFFLFLIVLALLVYVLYTG